MFHSKTVRQNLHLGSSVTLRSNTIHYFDCKARTLSSRLLSAVSLSSSHCCCNWCFMSLKTIFASQLHSGSTPSASSESVPFDDPNRPPSVCVPLCGPRAAHSWKQNNSALYPLWNIQNTDQNVINFIKDINFIILFNLFQLLSLAFTTLLLFSVHSRELNICSW